LSCAELNLEGLTLVATKVTRSVFKNYAYTVVDHKNKSAIFIDPAWEMDKIITDIEQYSVTPRAVLLTHHHMDHVHLAEDFAKAFNIPVYISQDEIDYYGYSCTNLVGLKTYRAFFVDHIYIKPIHTPGHTYGGICYLIGDYLFTGDTLFIEGCGACLGKGSDPAALYNTLQQLKATIPGRTQIYPGHSFGKEPGAAFEELLKLNIYCHFKTEKEFIDFRMRSQQNKTFSFK
jgi:hydroxyacylglutathione hydrolase